jgi:hypothetical protein
MAVGFVVVQLDDNGAITGYWDGSVFVPDVDLAEFYATKPNARYVQGSTQSQAINTDIVIKNATQDIAIN